MILTGPERAAHAASSDRRRRLSLRRRATDFSMPLVDWPIFLFPFPMPEDMSMAHGYAIGGLLLKVPAPPSES